MKVPYGYCQCQCGGLAPIAAHTNAKWGWVKGEPTRFIHGHNTALPRTKVKQPRNPLIRYLPLTHGKKTVIDTAKFERLSRFQYSSKWDPSSNDFYAYRTERTNGKHKIIPLHEDVMGRKAPKGHVIDHINRKPLDNRRKNLRIITRAQSVINRNMQSNNTSGFVGVNWHQAAQKWTASVRYNKIRYHLGYFNNKITAARVRNKKARELFREYYPD